MAGRILLVEDDAFLAFDLAQRLEQAGFTVAGPASSSTAALGLLTQIGCDAAVLDVHLGSDDTSEPVARELLTRQTPFVTVTGYLDEQRPAAFSGSPVLAKPIRFADLLGALQAFCSPVNEPDKQISP